MRSTAWTLTILLLCWAAPVLAEPAGLDGTPVELRMERTSGGQVEARRATILSEPRSPKIRGPIDGIDTERESFVVLGVRILVESSTRFDFDGGLGALEPGMMVEVRARARGAGTWKAKTIRRAHAGDSWKIKGTLESADTTWAVVDGVRIRLAPGVTFTRRGSALEEELFAVLQEEDGISRSLGGLQTPGGVRVSGSLRHHFRQEGEFEMRPSTATDISEPSLRLEVTAQPRDGWTLFSQLRWQGRFELRNDELVAGPADEVRTQVRQFYLTQRRLAGLPLGLIIGKQRMKDEREFLFDEYLDAVRLQFYGTAPLVVEASYLPAVFALKDKIEDWRDWLFRLRWMDEDRHFEVGSYALLRDDRSARQRDARYFGLSARARPAFLRVWSEAVLLRGRDKGQPQRAWAYDLGLAARADGWPSRPGVWVSIAAGSGDASPGDGTRQDFRQTGYEDNSDRVWGVANLANYGEVLDPELSNLRVVSAGLSVRARPNLSLDLFWHDYRLQALTGDFDITDLRILDTPLTGLDRDVGHELGFALGWRDLRPGLHAILRSARFSPGAAFGRAPTHPRRTVFEIRWDF